MGDVDFCATNLWAVAQPGDRISQLSGEVRTSAKRIQDRALSKHGSTIDGARPMSFADPYSVGKVVDYHTRGRYLYIDDVLRLRRACVDFRIKYGRF